MSHQHPQESWLVSGLGMAVSFVVLMVFIGMAIVWWQAFVALAIIVIGTGLAVYFGAKIMDDDMWDD